MHRKNHFSFLALLIGIFLIFPTISVFADTPLEGTEAPEFSLLSHEGTRVNLKDYRGKWVVLYFYPKDFTSGCTLEARNFQRDADKYKNANTVILGVSFDSVESHKSFCEKEGLGFKLLADTEGVVSSLYGSVIERNDSKISARNTFIINPQGRIVRIFLSVKPLQHSEEVLQALAILQQK